MPQGITLRQLNWRFYKDDSLEGMTSLGPENTVATLQNITETGSCTSIIRLRLEIGIEGGTWLGLTLPLQYSTDNVNFYDFGPDADWNYADGAYATEGNTISELYLSETTHLGKYYETSLPSWDYGAGNWEMDLAIKPTATVLPNTTYYFRYNGYYTGHTNPQVNVPPLDIFTYRGFATLSGTRFTDIQSFAFLSPSIFAVGQWLESNRINNLEGIDEWLPITTPGNRPLCLLEYQPEEEEGYLYAGCERWVFKYNSSIGSWTRVGGIFAGTIIAMIEFDGNIWVSDSPSGIVYYLDGNTSTWVSSGRLGTETSIISLAVIGSTLYGAGDLGKVYRYDGEDIWTAISPDNYYGQYLDVLDGELYGVSGVSGVATKIMKYEYLGGDPADDWTQVGGDLEEMLEGLFVGPRIASYEGKLYVSVQVSEILTKIYRWDDPDWVYIQYFEYGVTALEVENNILWAGLSSLDWEQGGDVWSYGPTTPPTPPFMTFMRHLKWFQDGLSKGCYLGNR